MNHYPITISGNDTGAIQLSSAGAEALGVEVGAALGYFLGKGKTLPLLIGAGLGYALGGTGILQQVIGSK